MGERKGLAGKGTPGRDLERAADRQAETTGGLNLPGTDVNREGTQGDWAAGDPEAGASLSVGEDYTAAPETVETYRIRPVLDTSYLESLFDDLDFPASKEDVMQALERRGEEHPDSGVDMHEVVRDMQKGRFMNHAELIAAIRSEIASRAGR
jgi:hypothetical protein